MSEYCDCPAAGPSGGRWVGSAMVEVLLDALPMIALTDRQGSL